MANGSVERSDVYFLTAKEAADYLRITVNTFYIWSRQKGGPPMYKLRSGPRNKPRLRVPKDKLMKWVETKNKES